MFSGRPYPPGMEKRQFGPQLGIRMSEAERRLVTQAAASVDRKESDWARKVILARAREELRGNAPPLPGLFGAVLVAGWSRIRGGSYAVMPALLHYCIAWNLAGVGLAACRARRSFVGS